MIMLMMMMMMMMVSVLISAQVKRIILICNCAFGCSDPVHYFLLPTKFSSFLSFKDLQKYSFFFLQEHATIQLRYIVRDQFKEKKDFVICLKTEKCLLDIFI